MFLWDRDTGTTTRLSVATDGTQASGGSSLPAISAEGRYISYSSWASDLVPGDANWFQDVFLWDQVAGTTTRVSIDSDGNELNGESIYPAISADGRYITYQSNASNIVPGDANRWSNVFVWDQDARITTPVNVTHDGTHANGQSNNPTISANGRQITYQSDASNLVTGDTNGESDVFLWDQDTRTTTRVSVAADGTQADDYCRDPAISADGRFVTYWSLATNLVPLNPEYGVPPNIFLWDMDSGTTTLVNRNYFGSQSNRGAVSPAMSADGRFITFDSQSTNLVPGDTNGFGDVFLTPNPLLTTG